jgi:long-chain fatty acid transport protein
MRAPLLWGVGSLFFASVMASSENAEASGYLTARYGTDHGSAAQANTFAVYYNPAALGGTTGTTITGDLSAVYRYASYTRGVEALSPATSSPTDRSYVQANTGKATLGDIIALPFLGVNTDFGTENFRAGYAAYIPFGGQAQWDKTTAVPGVPGAVDGPQRWHNISGRLLSLYNTFAVAYRFPDIGLSIGASVSPIVSSVSTVRAKNADGSDDTVVNGSLIEGRSLVEASGFNIGAAAGVYWESGTGIRLGASYTSQPGFGQMKMHGTLRTQLGAGQESSTSIDFLQSYPDLIRLAGAWRISRAVDFRANVEYIRWSVFKNQCVVAKGHPCAVNDDGSRQNTPDGQAVQLNVPRNWHDSIGFRLGPGVWVSDDLEIFGSYGMSTSPVPDATIDASTLDSTRLYFTAGAKYTVTKGLAIAASYNHIYFFPVDTKGANDLNISGHPSNTPDGANYNVSRSPSADGKYTSQVGFININAAYTF